MHPGDDVDHPVQCGVIGMDHHIDAIAQDIEVGIGDQGRNFDQPIGAEVQARHLAVDPHQFFPHSDKP